MGNMDFWETLSLLEKISPFVTLLLLACFLLLSNDFKNLKKDQKDLASETHRKMDSLSKDQHALNDRLDRLYSPDKPPAPKKDDHPLVVDS